jgi:hypothetical protein
MALRVTHGSWLARPVPWLEGIDIERIDPEGRLAQVTGFFGPLPALEPAS